MLKYKVLIKLFVLNCVFICCVYGNLVLKYKKCVFVCTRYIYIFVYALFVLVYHSKLVYFIAASFKQTPCNNQRMSLHIHIVWPIKDL